MIDCVTIHHEVLSIREETSLWGWERGGERKNSVLDTCTCRYNHYSQTERGVEIRIKILISKSSVYMKYLKSEDVSEKGEKTWRQETLGNMIVVETRGGINT